MRSQSVGDGASGTLQAVEQLIEFVHVDGLSNAQIARTESAVSNICGMCIKNLALVRMMAEERRERRHWNLVRRVFGFHDCRDAGAAKAATVLGHP